MTSPAATNSPAPSATTPSATTPGPSTTTPRLTTCTYGPASTEALRAAIERCRQDQPFSTVTIVVPSLALGFAAKKDLAWSSLRSSDGGGGADATSPAGPATPNGIFGLRLFTPDGLAEHIISICDPSAHIPNYSNRELMAALMQLGEGKFGVFEKIRSFPNTYEVLSQAVRELDRLNGAAVAKLKPSGDQPEQSAGPQLSSLLALREAVRGHFSGADNPIQRRSSADTLAKAVELVERESHVGQEPNGPVPTREHGPTRSSLWEYLGAVLVYLPQRLSTGEAELLRACHVSEIIVGLTGIAAADEMPLKSVGKIDASLAVGPADCRPPGDNLPPNSPTANSFRPRAAETVFMSAPTPADEVRLAVREATAAIQQGAPADQIAIAYTSASPYRRLLCETLQRSQIGFTHFSDMPLRERIAPRALLSMLALPDDDYKRIDLMNLLASAPIVARPAEAGEAAESAGAAGTARPTTPTGPPGDLVPSTAWDRISSDARVYQGINSWQAQIQAFIISREASKLLFEATEEEDSENKIKGIEEDIKHARALLAFVKSMEASVGAVKQAKTWREKVEAAKALLEEFLPEASLSSPLDVAPADVAPAPDAAAPPSPFEATQDLLSDEKAAHKRLLEILTSLASLDDVHPNPSPSDFRVLLDKELEAASGRLGQQNVGILIADISTLLAGSFSHIWILGVAEGHLPRKIREDSLLPESIRKSTADLMSEVSRVYEQQRQFLAALQLASHRICLSYSRLDSLGRSTGLPSRWLLDVVEEMTGEQKFAQELDDFIWRHYEAQNAAPAPVAAPASDTTPASVAAPSSDTTPTYKFIQSRTADLLSLEFPFQLQEYNLKSLMPSRGIQSLLQNHELTHRNSGFARGLDAHYSRNSPEFTRFDGNLTHKFSQLTGQPSTSDPAGIFAEPMSPTRLEKWSECPQRFFAESVLGIRPVEVPDDFEGLTPLVKGSIVHKILEDFFKEVLGISNSSSASTSQPPQPETLLAPDHTWSTQQRQRLEEIADSRCQEAIAKSLFGPEVFQQQEIDNIKSELLLFLDHEQAHRKQRNCSPVGMETDISQHQAFAYPLEGESSLPLRGRIDRVDVVPATGQLIIIDYKTGNHSSGKKPYRFQDLGEDNPTTHGRRLQMPLYLRAAELLYAKQVAQAKSRGDQGDSDQGDDGQDDTAMHDTAIYWFVNEASDFHRQELEFTKATQDNIRETLTTIYQQIAQGVFPPGFHSDTERSPFCSWCNPDGFGTSRHTQHLKSKSSEEQLAPWITLAYPDQLPESP